MQRTPPAGVVDDEVEHEVAAESVRFIGQLNELVDAGCFAVELNQRRIDPREIERGVRAAVTAHARVESGRHWVDGEQVQPLAFEAAKDVRQLCRQVAQRSAWRNDRPAVVLELGQTLIERRGGRLVGGFGRTEQAREGAVNSIPETGVRGVDADRDVFALNPVVETGRVADVGSCLKKTDLVQRHVDVPSAVVGRHLEVTPAFIGRCAAGLDRVDDRPQNLPRLAKRGAEAHLEGGGCGLGQRQLEPDRVADEAKVLAAGRRLQRRVEFPA